jgi:carbamoyl-phosphate synthase large subunit
LKALKEEGIKTVLLNPNIATVQTSEDLADRVYFLPVTPYFVEEVIKKELPQGILLSFGGQTALNCGVELYRNGILAKYNVEVLGTPVESIIDTEDRELFARKLDSIDIKTPKSFAVTSVKDAQKAAETIGFPLIIRAAYTLGGQGSGFCSDMESLGEMAEMAFSYSDQILVEESLKGWKEVEYEVVRDRYDNCITVCNMENFDPLGIHTGESIVVAPSQTLSNDDYQLLRNISIKLIRHIGIVGECNVQFALDPHSQDYRVIEVNARLSRSSALASKATGYPLACVAAKLALGYGLHELKNAVTKVTTALFEPALDYIVVKIPRWDLDKFSGVSKKIGSSMKSVGEVMAIGRTFEEAIQKGLRMIKQARHGFVGTREERIDDLKAQLVEPTDKRIFYISEAFEEGFSVKDIYELTKIDPWFLSKLKNIFDLKNELFAYNELLQLSDELLWEAKQQGFSDFQLARFVLKSSDKEIEKDILRVRYERKRRGILPVVKQIDTLAAEYPAKTNYLYLTYSGTKHDVNYEKDKKTVIVLGSGAYRIGSSVEFDWCSVSALSAARAAGYRAVMINYNPETVSTDYDICDRLYFDELSFERVMDIVDLEEPFGVIVNAGGQIPNGLAIRLSNQQVPLLGTSAESIDRAEDRHKFSQMLDNLRIDQPRWKELTSIDDIVTFADEVGFPLLIRPSYVLSGSAMNVVSNKEDLEFFLKEAATVSKQYPVVVSEFIEYAKEIEFDAVAKNGEIIAYTVSEHVEFAGVHSGDSTIIFPPQKIYVETSRLIKKTAHKIAQELNITGPFNIQFIACDNYIKVIECNLRASRSFPFVSKVLKVNLIELATQAVLGLEVKRPRKSAFDLEYIGVKASQFSFHRLGGADPVLGVDMTSTGEVGCIGDDFYEALLKAMLSVGYRLPVNRAFLSTGPLRDKVELLEPCRSLSERGVELYATAGTAKFLIDHNVKCISVAWPDDDFHPNSLDMIKEKKFDLIVNIPKNNSRGELYNDYTIRRSAVDYNIPLITNARLATAFIEAMERYSLSEIGITGWDEYKS